MKPIEETENRLTYTKRLKMLNLYLQAASVS